MSKKALAFFVPVALVSMLASDSMAASSSATQAKRVAASKVAYEARTSALENRCVKPAKDPNASCIRAKVAPNSFCELLSYGMHPYVVMGGSISASVGAARGFAAVEVVWDVYDLQQAAFISRGGGVGLSIGLGAQSYLGIAYGKKKNVIDAWAGASQSASVGVGTGIPFLGVGAAGFRSPDKSVVGGAIAASLSIDFLQLPIDLDLLTSTTSPWENGTKKLDKLTRGTLRKTTYEKKPASYVQFKDSLDFAASLISMNITMAPQLAALVLAISTAKEFGIEGC